MEIDNLAIGNRIRLRREELHMTRNELAEILDITPKFCSDIELGARGMSLKTLMCLSKTLYLSTDYILFGDETPNNQTPFSLYAESIPKEQAGHYLKVCHLIDELSDIKSHKKDNS